MKRGREDSPVKLRCVGFCGADDSVDPALLAAISAQHSWVEWGVLCRPDKVGLPRYASDEWIERLGVANAGRKMLLAAHLCERRVDELLRGDTAFVRRLHEDAGFCRFQINATTANGTDMAAFATAEGAERCVAALRAAFAALPRCEFILQRNAETRPLWERLVGAQTPANMSVLYDDSMGLGVSAASWPPPPPPGIMFGYAGGLGPANLAAKVKLMSEAAPGRTLWFDMESSLRTLLKDGGDVFDVNKAMACVRTVAELGMIPAWPRPPP